MTIEVHYTLDQNKIMDWQAIRNYVIKNKSQSHLCICNTDLFEATIVNGIYGFPHSGTSRLKSFWRSLASMYNVGKNDLIFIYRTNGDCDGCKEIHGPFRIFESEGQPATYYDLNSVDFAMDIKGETDCKVRFLFNKFENDIYSISDNYELIKQYELRKIWGYRHPAVMNIGAARKKSVSAFTNKQTLIFLDLFEEFGIIREVLTEKIPSKERIEYYENIKQNDFKFKINSDFLAENFTKDEACLYSYFISGLKNLDNYHSADLLNDFAEINNSIFLNSEIEFSDLLNNIMLEVIITSHLQDELDVVISDSDDENILFFEFKVGELVQKDIFQTEKYLSLLNAIYPKRKHYANLIGSEKAPGLSITEAYLNNIRLIKYDVLQEDHIKIRFTDITI